LHGPPDCAKTPLQMKKQYVAIVLLAFLSVALAKDQPFQVIVWPEKGDPVLRLTFGKFKEVGSVGSERTYITDTTAENLWSKRIPDASFALYVYDKNKVRIAEANVSVSNVAPGETIKFQTMIASSGPPVSLSVTPRYLPKELGPAAPPRTVSFTINTIPQGANARLDGDVIGITPKIVRIAVGKHVLDFSKEGFNPGKFPFEVGADDASGGSVSFELGTSAHDTIELRDGSILSGDVVSLSGMEVVIKVGGNNQSLNRNQVKRILLVEREAPAPASQ
jgi:hypothetical protein